MTGNQWAMLAVLVWIFVGAVVWAVVHGGTRKLTPCYGPADQLCYECQLERL